MSRRLIKFAKLHGTNCFVPGIGDLGSTFPPKDKTFASFSMYIENDKLWIDLSQRDGRKHSVFVPIANVQVGEASEPTLPEPKETEQE